MSAPTGNGHGGQVDGGADSSMCWPRSCGTAAGPPTSTRHPGGFRACSCRTRTSAQSAVTLSPYPAARVAIRGTGSAGPSGSPPYGRRVQPRTPSSGPSGGPCTTLLPPSPARPLVQRFLRVNAGARAAAARSRTAGRAVKGRLPCGGGHTWRRCLLFASRGQASDTAALGLAGYVHSRRVSGLWFLPRWATPGGFRIRWLRGAAGRCRARGGVLR